MLLDMRDLQPCGRVPVHVARVIIDVVFAQRRQLDTGSVKQIAAVAR